MPYRVCSKCKHVLNASEHFFCSNCGETLPKEITIRDVRVRVRTTFFKEESDSYKQKMNSIREMLSSYVSKIAKRPLVEILLLLNLLGMCVLIYQASFPKISGLFDLKLFPSFMSLPKVMESSESTGTPSLKVEEAKFENVKLNLTQGTLKILDFAKLFPNYTEVFYVGNKTSDISGMVVDSYDSSLMQKVKESSGSFAYGAIIDKSLQPDVYVIWAFVVEDDFSEEAKAGVAEEFPDLTSLSVGNYYVVSNSEDYASDIKDTINKSMLSLANSATYTLISPSIPKSGGGVAITFVKESNVFFDNLKNQPIISEFIKAKLDHLNDSSYNYLVIN